MLTFKQYLRYEYFCCYLCLLMTGNRLKAKQNMSLQWRHNGCDGVSNHQLHDCLLNRLFRRRSKKTPKLRVNAPCVGNSPVTREFPTQMASNAENVSIWWRHHVIPNQTEDIPHPQATPQYSLWKTHQDPRLTISRSGGFNAAKFTERSHMIISVPAKSPQMMRKTDWGWFNMRMSSY